MTSKLFCVSATRGRRHADHDGLEREQAPPGFWIDSEVRLVSGEAVQEACATDTDQSFLGATRC
jgi:hypothetical protein